MGSITRGAIHDVLDEAYGNVVAEGWASDGRPVLVVLTHEYRIPLQQQNLFVQAEALLARFPSSEVLLEELDGTRKLPAVKMFGSTIKDPAKRSAKALKRLEAKGILASELLADLYPGPATITGVDGQDALDRQHQCLRDIDSRVREGLPSEDMGSGELMSALGVEFGAICEALEAALNEKLKSLLALRKQFTSEWKIAPYAIGLAELARSENVDTAGYPSLHAFVSSLETERQLDFEVIEKERNSLIQRIVEHSVAPSDPPRARALAQWMEVSPVPEGTVLESHEVIPGNPSWLLRLIELSKAYSANRMTIAEYMRTLQGLLDALGMSASETSPLGRYIRYLSVAEGINLNDLLERDLPGLVEELADVYTTSAVERGILDLTERSIDLTNLFALQIPASRLRAVLGSDRSPVRWMDEVLRVGDTALGRGWLENTSRQIVQLEAAAADRARKSVTKFYELAVRRSERMVALSLESKAPLTILVCGRFHLHEALRVLRVDPPVSWIVFAARAHSRPASQDQRLSVWNWGFPGYEWAFSETLTGGGP